MSKPQKKSGSKQKTIQKTPKDPIEAVQASRRPKETDIKLLINHLGKTDSEFTNAVQEARAQFKICEEVETQFNVAFNDAKKFHKAALEARTEVADKLRQVIPKLTQALGDNISRNKVIFTVANLLRFSKTKDQEDENSKMGKSSVTGILKIYEEKNGPIVAGKPMSEPALGEGDSEKGLYEIMIKSTDVLDKIFDEYEDSKRDNSFYYLKIGINSNYNVKEIAVIRKGVND
jgi:hypothetical protein